MGREIFGFTADPAGTDLAEITVGIVELGLFTVAS
jgi:hypothetical protein